MRTTGRTTRSSSGLHLIALGAVIIASLLVAGSSSAEPQDEVPPCLTSEREPLPLIERNVPGTAPLTLLLTGDGGWANADQKVAEGLMARGSAVIGVNMRSYLGKRRTPDEVARDMACVARRYGQVWHRDKLLLLGYSRGADLAPFVAARWPADLRARLTMVALVSMSSRANFQFHLIDLVRDVERQDDLPIAPELQRLRGLNLMCVSGDDDSSSGCATADSTIVRRYTRPGGHRITGGFEAIVGLIAPALAP